MGDPRPWCRIRLIRPDGTEAGTWTLDGAYGAGRPELDAVDRLARLALHTSRAGLRLAVVDICPEVAELVELAGLDILAPQRGVSGVEVERQPEGGEQALGIDRIEEQGHLGDPPP